MTKMNWRFIVIHHSATRDYPEGQSWGVLRENHRLLGYDDIGYHFGVELARGHLELQIGRSLNTEGAHCLGVNQAAIGVCCVGNLQETEPPDGLYQFLGSRIVRPLMDMFEIPAEGVMLHRELKATLCPGKHFKKEMLLDVLKKA